VAVSQNAVKHGLFAELIFSTENEENEAYYEVFHDKMIEEFSPVGDGGIDAGRADY
jgi:hypothetical protein